MQTATPTPTAPAATTASTTQPNISTNPSGLTPLVPEPSTMDGPITVTVDRHHITMGHKARKSVLYTTAIMLPPLAVYFRRGTDKDFILSIVLTILGWCVLLSLPSTSCAFGERFDTDNCPK